MAGTRGAHDFLLFESSTVLVVSGHIPARNDLREQGFILAHSVK